MTTKDHRNKIKKQKIAEGLEPVFEDIKELSHKLLDPYEVRHNIVDYDEMNELIAYGGFQERFPHYSWGQNYMQQKAMDKLAGGALEIVNNDDPANSFLMESNSRAEQKGVITHVEAHSDFFANNPSFFYGEGEKVNAAQMLAQNAEQIRSYADDPDIDEKEVERLIDLYKCLEMNINPFKDINDIEFEEKDYEDPDVDEKIEDLGFESEEVKEVMGDTLEEYDDDKEVKETYTDLLKVLIDNGKRYDEEAEKEVDMEDWQLDTLSRLREESYYFRGQAKTKIMNEGWATYWQSFMMQEEGFADENEFLDHGKLLADVLKGPPSRNPYKLGLMLWEYAENKANRREVVKKLMDVEGINKDNFDDLDFDYVLEELEPDELVDNTSSFDLRELARMEDDRLDYESIGEMLRLGEDVKDKSWKPLNFKGLAERHFSLLKPENRSFIQKISRKDVEDFDMFSENRYNNIEEALEEVDKTSGWNKMKADRDTKNDIGFIDEHVTQEFIDENEMWLAIDLGKYYLKATHEETPVKNKLLIDKTNFGKPRIEAVDQNYENKGDLMLEHQFNGLDIDIGQAKEVIKRIQPFSGKGVGIRLIKNDIDREYLMGIQEAFMDKNQLDTFDEVIDDLPRPEKQGFELLYRPDEEFDNDSDVVEELGVNVDKHFRVKELDEEEIEDMEVDQEFDPVYSTLKMQ